MRLLHLFIFIFTFPVLTFAQQDDDQDDDDTYKTGRFRFVFQEHLNFKPPVIFKQVGINATRSDAQFNINLSSLSESVRNKISFVLLNGQVLSSIANVNFVGLTKITELDKVELLDNNQSVLVVLVNV